MPTPRLVTLYQSHREDGLSVEVKRQDCTALHRTDAYGTSAESWEAAYLRMRENGLALGPYRVEPDVEEERGMGATPVGSTDRARGLVTGDSPPPSRRSSRRRRRGRIGAARPRP